VTDAAFNVLAIVSTYNEEDVIEATIGHLVANEIPVVLIDNGSTDRTVEAASAWLGRGLLAIERFERREQDRFDWEAILLRKEEIARAYPASWYIHHDADEIRHGPWPQLNLKQAIQSVDAFGFNCIDFEVFQFRPIDDGFERGADPVTYFAFYEDAEDFDHLQLKCWKATPEFDLVGLGGHDVQFSERRVFPVKFILRHYPIRSERHGRRKVFDERLPRFREEERSRGWHVQYERFVSGDPKFLFDPAELRRFDLDEARLQLLVHNEAWQEQRRTLDAIAALKEELEQDQPELARRLEATLEALREPELLASG
jgi:glycosyltransferase involved in cell wall biosynthesis